MVADQTGKGPSRLARFQARQLARIAVKRGLPATVCPYDPNSADHNVRALARVFLDEYQLRRQARQTPTE